MESDDILFGHLPHFVEVVADSADRQHWLEQRKQGVCASEVSALFGENPWLSELELYAIKRGESEQEDLSRNEAVYWGTALEAAIVRGYADRTGRHVRPFGRLVRSLRHDAVLATPDAFTSIDGASWWPLQVKNIGNAAAWADGAPRHYRLQCLHEALVCGSSKCTIAALVGGQRLIWEDLELDRTTEQQIATLAQRFMDAVATGHPPSPDGSASAHRALQRLYRRTDGNPDPVTLPASLGAIDGRLVAAREAKRVAEREIATCEQAITAAMMGRETAQIAGIARYTWKPVVVPAHARAEGRYRRFTRREWGGE